MCGPSVNVDFKIVNLRTGSEKKFVLSSIRNAARFPVAQRGRPPPRLWWPVGRGSWQPHHAPASHAGQPCPLRAGESWPLRPTGAPHSPRCAPSLCSIPRQQTLLTQGPYIRFSCTSELTSSDLSIRSRIKADRHPREKKDPIVTYACCPVCCPQRVDSRLTLCCPSSSRDRQPARCSSHRDLRLTLCWESACLLTSPNPKPQGPSTKPCTCR